MSSEKLQKVLARAGVASRRTIETWIAEGRILVNGITARLGTRVDTHDEIKIDGKRIKTQTFFSKRRLILYYKPEGEICTRSDPQGRPTVFDSLPTLPEGRWIAVGRLDLNTAGLLLFTNDGELAHRLMHPSFNLEREYLVRVLGQVSPAIITKLRQGVLLEDGKARFEKLEELNGHGANRWYCVTVKEGKNRLVRRLWESQGLKVSRLKRIRYGDFILPRYLRPGQWMEVSDGL